MASDPVPDHVHQAVESVAAIHARGEATVGKHQRKIEWLTSRLGRPGSLYAILIVVVMWIAVNLLLAAAKIGPPDPPPFYYLQGIAAVGSLLMATVILTTQNRQTRHAEQRQQLDLQVNLLAEAKIAKLIDLIEELRRDLPSVPNRLDPVADAMKQSVDPGQVLAALQRTIDTAGAVVVEDVGEGSGRGRQPPPDEAPRAAAGEDDAAGEDEAPRAAAGEAARNPPPDEAAGPPAVAAIASAESGASPSARGPVGMGGG